MAVSPNYSFAICGGTDPNNLVNVELLQAGGRYFYPPTLEQDSILRQPASNGVPFERGYRSFEWRSNLWRDQYKYLYTTILSSSLQGPVVIRTLTIEGDSTYTVYRAVLTLPDFSGFQRNYKQYENVPWAFTRCVLVT
jgi:hypothetical protein